MRCVALADDRRLARAERVDALAHDFGRGVHRLADRLVDPGLGRASGRSGCRRPPRCPSRAGRSARRRWSAAASTSRAASTWPGSSSMKLSARRRGRDVADADARLGVRSAVRTLSSMLSSRCAATWRGSASSRMWLPPARSRPRLTIGLGQRRRASAAPASDEQRGQRGERADQRHAHSQTLLPARKIEHRRSRRRSAQSLAGGAGRAAMTSPMVDLTALTLTPWAISISA